MFKSLGNSIIILVWSIFAFVFLVYWLKIGGESTIILRNTLYLFIPFIAICSGVFSLSQYGTKGSRTITLLLLTLGVGCWFIGEVIFYSYEFILHIDPFPSVADFFYIIAYPLILFALINEMRQTTVNWKKIHPSIIFLFCIAAIALALIVLYFGVYLAYSSQESLFTNIIAMGYGVGDLLLIIVNICVLTLVWEFRRGRFSRMWILLFASFIFMMIGDILFAIYNQQYKAEVWFYKSLLDSFWMVSYMLFATGLFDFGFSILQTKTLLKGKNKK